MGPERPRHRHPNPHRTRAADWATYYGKSLNRERRSPTGPATSPAPRTAPKQDGSLRDKLGPGPGYQIPTGGQQSPVPTDTSGQAAPGGDILAQIMRELAKAIEDGRLKPVVVGSRSAFLDKPDLPAKRRIRWETSSVKSCVTYSVAKVVS